MKKSVLSALLVLSMLVSVSCASASGGKSDTVSAGTTAPETTAEVTTSDPNSDSLPELDFGGAEWNILTTLWYDAPFYIYAENQNGDIINDALYKSRTVNEERFNVKINLTADQQQKEVSDLIHSLVLSGDDTYHLIHNHDTYTAGNAMNGDFLDIRSLDYIDFDKPWWEGTPEDFTIAGKLLFTTNALSLTGIFQNCVLTFNKKLAADNGIEIPYEAVKNGDWYMDDLIEMTSTVKRDLNGDGSIGEDDMFGLVTSYYGKISMLANPGGSVAVKNSEGEIMLNTDTARIISIMEQYERLMENGTDDYGASNEYGAHIFTDNRALFTFAELRTVYNTIRYSDVTYGFLPYPKYDETQENYESAGCGMYWAVPKTASELDMTGVLLEAVSCYNYNNVVPEVWETVLGRKLSDSPDDADMFNLIRPGQHVDLGFAFSFQATELSQLVFILELSKAENAASFIDARRDAVNAAFDKINTFYRDAE